MLVGDFDPARVSSAWRGTPTRTPVGSESRAPIAAADFDPRRPRSAGEVVAEVGAEAEPAGDEPTDDAEADLRRHAYGLIPLAGLDERRAQTRIDALAKRIADAPAAAPGLSRVIDELASSGHFDGAEGVIAALGRADVGVPVLKGLIEDPVPSRRLRGAAALALVQTRDARRLDVGKPRAEAYARASGDARAKGIEAALWSAYHGLVDERDVPDVGSERALDACVAWGLHDASDARGHEIAVGRLRAADPRVRLRVLAALAGRPELDAGTYVAVRRVWREDRDRAVRRAAIAVAVAARPDSWFWEDAVPVLTDTSRLGSLRVDLLAGLALRHPIAEADGFLFERWIPALAAWCEAEPALRDEAPTADARPGPFVRFVDVPSGDRVAALASAVDRATGGRSTILHEAAKRLASSVGR